MTELAIRTDSPADIEPYQPQVVAPTSAGLVRLADWAQEARAAAALAASLCKTSFVPEHFRNKPEETTAAILTGCELGLPPVAALRAIFVFKGVPGMYAKTMQAVVQRQGHEVWIPEQSDEKVVVKGQRRGSEHVYETTWTPARVEKAGLTTNPLYKKSPQQMMVARGLAEISRQVDPGALLGIPYSVEEIEDFDDRPIRAELTVRPPVTTSEILGVAAGPAAKQDDVDGEAPAPAPNPLAERAAKAIATFGGRGISREQTETKVGKPVGAWDEADLGTLMIAYQAVMSGEEFDPQPAGPKPMTARHRARMFALFADVERTDEDDQRAYMTEKLGREVTSRGSLTDDECVAMIGHLESWKSQNEPPAGDL